MRQPKENMESKVVFHCDDKEFGDYSWKVLQFMPPLKVGAELYFTTDDEQVTTDAEQNYVKCMKKRLARNNRKGLPRNRDHKEKKSNSRCKELLEKHDKRKFEFKWVYFENLSQYLIPFGVVIGILLLAFIIGTVWDYFCKRKSDRYNISGTPVIFFCSIKCLNGIQLHVIDSIYFKLIMQLTGPWKHENC